MKCGNVKPKNYKTIIESKHKIWTCPVCLPVGQLDLNSLSFNSVSDSTVVLTTELKFINFTTIPAAHRNPYDQYQSSKKGFDPLSLQNLSSI